MVPGPGNPALSNIYVHSFNPDVSAPAVCARCAETPCVNACPVDPEPGTGRRAIFQDEKYMLRAADVVRYAIQKMFDDYSPLPRINTTDTLYSGNGTPYLNFYHAPGGSDDLMWALALYAQEAGWIIED